MPCNGYNKHPEKIEGVWCPATSMFSTPVFPEPNQNILGRLGGKVEARLPSLRPNIDLFVFLAEAREIMELVNVLKFQAGTLLEKAAGKNLEMHFAVLPMIGEMKSIIRMIASLKTKYNGLVKGAGKVHDLKASVINPLEKTVTEFYSDNYYPPGCTQDCPTGFSPSTYVLTSKYEEYYSATVKYRYAMPEHSTEFGRKLGAILTTIGLDVSIESYWELIPFSFVVDWIFNTDRLFKALHLDDAGLDVSTEIIDCCVVRRGLLRRNLEYNMPCFSMYTGNDIGLTDTSIVLDRWVGDEAYEMLNGPWFKLPGFMQLHLGASLLVQLNR
jgi:hypothetical protein